MINKSDNLQPLPKILWNYFLLSIGNYLSMEYESDLSTDSQVWTIIPNTQREWISFEELENSVFFLKRNLIGLDFNESSPMIASGKYWIDAIKNSKDNDFSLESRNIYIFDHKMSIFVFYVEGSGILIFGKNKHLAKVKAIKKYKRKISMTELMKKSILELRNRIPVKLIVAKKLLEQTNFNVQEAESIWKTNQVNILAKKISVAPKEASELLKFVEFELGKAISLFEKRNTTDVEKILKSVNSEVEVLANFWVCISDNLGSDVKYGEWTDEKGFQQLPELTRNILIVWQWYAYYDNEGTSVEQTITNDFIRILDEKFELKDFAQELEHLKVMMDKFHQKNPYNKMNVEKYTEKRNKFVSSEEYIRIDKKIEDMEELIMKKSYELLYANSEIINEQIISVKRKEV